MSSKLQLNCLIWGDYSLYAFEITIEGIESVSSLKDAIKTKQSPRLNDVSPEHLLLYRTTISIPLDGRDFEANKEFESAVCQAPDRKSPLRNKQTLSDVFSANLNDDELHVVVIIGSFVSMPPTTTVKLSCVAWSKIFKSGVFPVTIDRRALVGDLKRVIQEHSFRNVDVPELVIWSIMIPDDGSFEKSFKEINFDSKEPLQNSMPLSICFPIEPTHSHVHVIAGVRESTDGHSAPVINQGTPIDVKRREFLRSNPPRAPSNQATAAELLDRQDSEDRKVLFGRPRKAISIISPILLCRDFGQFLDGCQTCEGTAADNKFVLDLSILMSKYYQYEDDRAAQIRAHFIDWGLKFNTSTVGKNYKTDGDLRVGPYRYAIMEVKNEVGTGGGDPYAQAGFYYLESTRGIAEKRHDSVLPCFIINIFGPYLCISGAVWTDRPTMQVLSTALPLHHHPMDTKMQSVIVRHLCSLKKALNSLEQYYQNVLDPSPIPRPAIRNSCFPYPTEFVRRGDGAVQAFEYRAQFFETKLLFSATLAGTNTEVCIKFAESYSEETHSFCASNGFAPALHGFQPLPGGWFMVVMDILDDSYVDLVGCQSSVPPQLFDQIEERLIQMHQHGYVHGDVRDTNVMVSKQDKTFMLVDFDWAGKIGEARYPLNVNRKGVTRPEGAEDGKLVKAEHDIMMLAGMRPEDLDNRT